MDADQQKLADFVGRLVKAAYPAILRDHLQKRGLFKLLRADGAVVPELLIAVKDALNEAFNIVLRSNKNGK